MVRTPAPSGWTASHPAQAHRARPKRRRAIGSEAGAPRRIVPLTGLAAVTSVKKAH